MYLTVRQMQADMGRMQDALSFVGYVVGRLNSEHGAAMRASVNIGGDPSAIAISGQWETLGGYAAMRQNLAADDELQSAIRVGSALFTGAEDSIAKVLKPAGEEGNLAVVNTARMQLPRVAEAVAFALEVASFVEELNDTTSGVATAVTGDRAQLMWFGLGDDLDQFAADSEKLEGSEEYLNFFKRSEELFEPGSLNQSIWQFIA